MGKRQFVTVSEWMVHGTIMDYIENYHSNRLRLVRDLAIPPLPPLNRGDSYTRRRKVWGTSIVSISHMGTSKGSGFLCR